MPSDVGPGVAKSVGIAREAAAECDSPGYLLPSCARLARTAGVSPRTMLKALKLLQADGVLEGVKGRRFSARGKGGGRVGSGDRRLLTRREIVRMRLESEILRGVYRPGAPFPSVKELLGRYGVSYPTMRAAIDDLVLRGLVVSHARGFGVPAVGTRRATARMVLFVSRDSARTPLDEGAFNEEFLRRFEFECSQAAIGIDVVAFHYSEGRPSFVNYATGQTYVHHDRPDTLGYFFMLTGAAPVPDSMLRAVHETTKPVVLLDAAGDVRIPELVSRSPRFRHFSVGVTTRAGSAIARYLLGLGHRKIAYLSPFHWGPWSERRVEGLREGFAAAGLTESVVKLVVDPSIDNTAYVARAAKRCPVDLVGETLVSWIGTAPASFTAQLRPFIDDAWEDARYHGEVALCMEEILDKARADRSITAWVMSNDFTAKYASDYMKRKGIHAPVDVSLVSFDDSQLALRHSFTSYNFNIPAIVTAMVAFVLGRPSPLPPKRSDPVVIDGVVVERGTVKAIAEPRRGGQDAANPIYS